jgi:hypothetical protein
VRRQIYITFSQCVTEKFMKNLWGKEKDKTQAALDRLDRLTKDEVLTAVAQTLGVVHGIADDMRVVMGGALFFLCFLVNICLNTCCFRSKCTTGWYRTESGYVSRANQVSP